MLQETVLQQATARGAIAAHIEVFRYPADPDAPPAPAWNEWAVADDEDVSAEPADSEPDNSTPADVTAAFEQRLAEETRRAFEAGRERGRQEERQALAGELAGERVAARDHHARQMASLVETFAAERDRYLHAVEQEVVRLALAVAARILRREAQMDPLLLTGAVRVALGQLSASIEVRLGIPAGDLDLWTEAIALLPNLAVKPEVKAREGLRLGDCILETKMGTVDLGVRSQLGEIERGFFDRAGAAPRKPDMESDRTPIAERPT